MTPLIAALAALAALAAFGQQQGWASSIAAPARGHR
jgi:hypothetical protein